MEEDKPYSNREIREKWHDIANDLQAILTQTTMHNGRMTKLEKWQERMNGGTLVAGAFMVAVVVPILAWSLYSLVKLPDTIHQAIEEALAVYDIQK